MEVTMEVTMEVKKLLKAITGEHSRRALQEMLRLKNAGHGSRGGGNDTAGQAKKPSSEVSAHTKGFGG